MAYISQNRQLHLDLLFDALNSQPINLLPAERCTRIQLIHTFFPDLPVTTGIQEGRKGGKTAELLERLPAESRTFCTVCHCVDETFKNYLNYFFTAQRDKSAFCRNLFVALFDGKADPIIAMTDQCTAALKAAGLHNLPEDDKRCRALAAALEKAMNALAAQLPELSLPAEIFGCDIHRSLPAGLARTIASYAVYLDVSAFKNDHKRLEMLKQLQDLFYAIWKIQPQDVAWQSSIAAGIHAFHEGDYPLAQERFCEASRLLEQEDRRSNYHTVSYANLLSYQAHMLLDGSGGERSFAKACQLIHSACQVTAMDGSQLTAPRRLYESAFCQLFHPDEWKQHGGKTTDWLALLERAAQEGCMDALVLLADIWLTGAHGCEALKDPAKGIALLEAGTARPEIPPQQRAQCELRLAQHYLTSSDPQQADLYYEKAAHLGSYHAIVHLREKHFHPEEQVEVTIPIDAHGRICFFNSSAEADDANHVLRTSLTSDWVQRSGSIGAMLKAQPELLKHRQILFAFLSGDERQNLQDALETLKLLNSVAYQQDESARMALMQRVDLFVLTREEASRMMLDAAMNQLAQGIYFRIHTCDPELMAANELLQRCPTFLPCIDHAGNVKEERWKHQKKNERFRRRIVLLGTSRAAMMIAREIIACTYLEEFPTTLSVIGPDAQRMEEQFREECPGLFSSEQAQYIVPQFFTCPPDALPLHRTGEGLTAQIHSILHEANYFAVVGDDDMDNVSLAVRLRTALIRARLPQGLQPVIAVLYRNARTQWIAAQIAVGARGGDERFHWTENYGLQLFGSSDAFRYEALVNNPLEKRAIAVHKSYYHLNGDAMQEHAALKEYYRRSYNRDSSACLAMGMIYHCFGMGIYHSRWEDYASPAGDAVLGARYQNALCEEQVEKAAIIEHDRWNSWCLSRGWTKPEDDVLVTYMKMGNPRHHLEIGKLHPYITSYQQLIHECSRLNELLDAYQHTHKKLPDPRISDRELVQRIPTLLNLTEQTDEMI